MAGRESGWPPSDSLHLYRIWIRHKGEPSLIDQALEDVIADADVSWATFFRYFPRKGDVLIRPRHAIFATRCGHQPRDSSRIGG